MLHLTLLIIAFMKLLSPLTSGSALSWFSLDASRVSILFPPRAPLALPASSMLLFLLSSLYTLFLG